MKIEYRLMKGSFQCPECGSWNTGQATYVDFCNDCDWRTIF